MMVRFLGGRGDRPDGPALAKASGPDSRIVKTKREHRIADAAAEVGDLGKVSSPGAKGGRVVDGGSDLVGSRFSPPQAEGEEGIRMCAGVYKIGVGGGRDAETNSEWRTRRVGS